MEVQGGGTMQLDNTGTINGDVIALIQFMSPNVTIPPSIDTINNAGSITGSVLLDGGDDTVISQSGGTIGGTVDGGLGVDGLILAVASAPA